MINENTEQNDVFYEGKSRKPFIFLIVSIIIVALASVLVYFFVKGNGNLTYRQAERSCFVSLAGSLLQNESKYNALDYEFILSPSEDFFTSMNPTVFKGGVVSDENELYSEFTYLNGSKDIISATAYIKENLFYFCLPEISDYIFEYKLNETQITAKFELDISSAYETFDAVLDKYFELTESEAAEKNAEVSHNGITKRCDRYTVVMDKEMLREFLIFSCETMQENQNLIDYINSVLNADAEEYIKNLKEALESGYYNDIPDFKITMDAYVSGNDIIKRDFSFEGGYGGGNASFININDGNKYSQYIFAETEKDSLNTIILENNGEASDGKATGEASFVLFSKENDLESYTVEFKYTDYFENGDGLVSGIFEISIPENGIVFYFTSEITGDEMIISGSLDASYETFFDVILKLKYSKNKKIDFNVDNAYSINNIEKTGEFYNAFTDYFGDLDSVLADENGNYDILGGIFSMFSGMLFGNVPDFGIIGGADGPTVLF